MAMYGQLREFQPEGESIVAYLERADLYFQANEIAEEKQVSVFLCIVRPTIYALLRDLVAPLKPQAKTLKELCKLLTDHFEARPIIIAEWFKFHRRSQGPNETISEYVAELRKLASTCDLGEILNQALRDRLVCGLSSTAIQRRLLSERKLDLQIAVEIAQGMEAADKGAKWLQGGDVPVCHVSQNAPEQEVNVTSVEQKLCFRGGASDHLAMTCRFEQAICRWCKKRGHIARVCRSSAQRYPKRGHQGWRGEKRVFTMEGTPVDLDDDTCLEAEYTKFCLHQSQEKPIVVNLHVEQHLLSFEVDTGAAVSVMSSLTFRRHFPEAPLRNSTVILRTYTGEQCQWKEKFWWKCATEAR